MTYLIQLLNKKISHYIMYKISSNKTINNSLTYMGNYFFVFT